MMMMYAAPKFYHGSQVVYNSSKILVKQEPMDLMDRNRPVDMRISVRDSRAGTNLYIPMSPELMSCKSDKFYGCHTAAYHQESKTQSSMDSSIHLLGSSAERHIVSSSTPPLEKDCYQTKSCDGKLLVPSVLTKNGRTTGFSSLDMLPVATHHRAKREFVPDCKKDDSYWCKRLKNNDSARRSRVKRKALEKMMESRLLELQKENIELKHEVAALRRRFGEEEGSNSDSSSSSSRDQASSSMSDNTKAEDDQQNSGSDDSCSNDDSRVYGVGRASATNRDLMLTSRDRVNSTESLSSSPSSSVISGSPRPGSRNSQGGSVDAGLRTDVTGALDLTSDCGSRSTLAWESSSTDSFSSARTTSKRRSSCLSSDGGGSSSSSSSQEDSSIRSLKVFPLKCRWKKEMYGSHMPVTEP